MGFWAKALGRVVGSVVKDKVEDEVRDRTRLPGEPTEASRSEARSYAASHPGWDQDRFIAYATEVWTAVYDAYALVEWRKAEPYIDPQFLNTFANFQSYKDSGGGGLLEDITPRVIHRIGIEDINGDTIVVRVLAAVPMPLRTRDARDRSGAIAVDDFHFRPGGTDPDPNRHFLVRDIKAIDTLGPDVDLGDLPGLGDILGL